jgi:hypothetical protein
MKLKGPRPSRSEAHAELPAHVDEAPGSPAPLLMSREETARALGGIHVQTVTKLARAGKLERVFIGRRSMIASASVEALVRSAPRTSPVLPKRPTPAKSQTLGAKESLSA